MCDLQSRIVDQAKARGNARDTGVVPGHLRMELNSTIAEEVTVGERNEGMSERRVDDGETHRRKWNSDHSRLEPGQLACHREVRPSLAAANLHGQSARQRHENGISTASAGFFTVRETAGHSQDGSGE